MLVWIIVILILFALSVAYEFYRTRDMKADDVFESIENKVILKIKVGKHNDRTSAFAEQMFVALHGILGSKDRSKSLISLEIFSYKDGINFFIVCEEGQKEYVTGQMYAQYPDLEIDEVEDYTEYMSSNVVTNQIELQKDFIFPIKTYQNFEVDPLASTISAMGKVKEDESCSFQCVIRPVDNTWQNDGRQYITKVRAGMNPLKVGNILSLGLSVFSIIGKGFFLIFQWLFFPSFNKGNASKPSLVISPAQEKEIKEIENKISKLGFEVILRVSSSSNSESKSQLIIDDIVSTFKQYNEPHLNAFHVSKIKGKKKNLLKEKIWADYKDRFMAYNNLDILNTAELASVFHFPTSLVDSEKIKWSGSKKIAPPLDLPVEVSLKFAKTNFRGGNTEFGIKKEDRRRHMYIIGKTGSGKSTLLKNMVISDIINNEGLCVLDPHGDLIDDVLNFIPVSRVPDVVILDPSDIDHPLGINIFELKDKTQKDLVADSIVNVFKKHFDSWGPRLEYILRYAVLTLLSVDNSTILGVLRILTDKDYREYILSFIDDPLILKFWKEEYASFEKNLRLHAEVISPIQNKVGRFLSSSTIRNMLGQEKSTIDLSEIMDSGKILLVNLSQGKIGEENCSLLGGLLITRLQSEAIKRAFVNEEERKDFYLYVDEFQTFATHSFSKILSEARKYRLNIILAHQYIQQLEEEVRNAVFGNIGTLISFVVGNYDASILAREFAPHIIESDLISLENYHIYIKEMINGIISNPFSAVTLNVSYEKTNNKQMLVSVSRETYGREREKVEEDIKEWLMKSYSKRVAQVVEPRVTKEDNNIPRISQESLEIVSNKKDSNDIEQKAHQLLKSSPFYLGKEEKSE